MAIFHDHDSLLEELEGTETIQGMKVGWSLMISDSVVDFLTHGRIVFLAQRGKPNQQQGYPDHLAGFMNIMPNCAL